MLSQREYQYGKPTSTLKNGPPGKWVIPIKIKGKGIDSSYYCLLPDEPNSSIRLEGLDNSKWIYANEGKLTFKNIRTHWLLSHSLFI